MINVMDRKIRFVSIIALAFVLCVSGCAGNKELEKINKQQAASIVALNDEIARLNEELDALSRAKEELAHAKADLERKLKSELEKGDLEVSMEDRGLVVTLLDRILFDSGKAKLKESSLPTLNKLADILASKVKDNLIYVEGHTDNVPIKYSGWRSNWELSTTRATEVVHYFTDKGDIKPERLIACGYGEYHPVASNETAEGREKNRRVEIIISPKSYTKVKEVALISEEETEEEYIK